MGTEETKHEKFMRIMTLRLGNALTAIGRLVNLAGPNYENSPEEAQAVKDHLDKAVGEVYAAFGLEESKPETVNATPEKQQAERISSNDGWVKVDEAFNALNDGNTVLAKQLLKEALSA